MSATFIFLIIIILVGAAIGGLYFLGLPPFNKTKRDEDDGAGDGTSNGGGTGDEDEVVTDQQYTEVNDKYLDGTEVAERSSNVNLDACKAICTGNPSCAQFFRTQGDECRYFNDTATQKISEGGSIIYIKMQ